MKRILPFIALIAAVGLMVWVFARRLNDEASPAPRVESVASPDGNSLSLKELKGKYVLVNFWDSSNAVSRIATGEYDRFFRTHPDGGMEMLSVNTDTDRGLFSQIARKDGLDLSRQFHIADVRAGSLRPGYKPSEGFSSYLVSPSGKVVATNPSVETLEKYISSRNE